MNETNKIVFNTGVLYIRLLISLVISMFTTRMVISSLGEANYGIYMLVAGVVGMLGVLNSNMANTSMRFMAHGLGSGDRETISKTFNTTLFLHFIIGLIVMILMEIGGWFLFEYFLNIPVGRIFDAKIIFHFMVITTFVTIISVPYDAVIKAHENFLALSLFDLFVSFMSFGVAIYLTYSNTNLLVLYGFLMFVIQLISRFLKQWYSKINYAECKIKFKEFVDKKLLKSILSFTGWNLFGSIAAMASTQVRGVLINMFFGVRLNAAEGLANSVSAQVNMVSVSLTQAINPQLVKSEGGGDRARMIHITQVGTKYSTILFALFGIPLFLEAPYLFSIWLKKVPDFTVVFFQFILISQLVEKFTFQIGSAVRAVGEVKNFQIFESIISILSIPIAYYLFTIGFGPEWIYIIGLIAGLLTAFVRLYFGKSVVGINVIEYFKSAIFPSLSPLCLSIALVLPFKIYMENSLFQIFITTSVYVISLLSLFWLIGMNNTEQKLMKSLCKSIVQKFKNK